jgi:hypothetical protein
LDAEPQQVYGDKLRERILLLRRFLPHLEWSWPNEVRLRVSQEVFGGKLPADKPVKIEELAGHVTDEQLEKMVRISPLKDYCSFRGKYYTVRRGGIFDRVGSWDEVKAGVRQILKVHGKKGYALLKALTEVTEAPFEAIAARASEIYGERYHPSQLIAELRDRWDLAWEVGTHRYPKWAMPEEVKSAVIEVLSEFEAKPVPQLSTPQAQREFLEVVRMEEEFRSYLERLISERLEETISFGKEMSPSYLVDYLQSLFGPVIFFDHLLSITQQYSICDSEMVSEAGSTAGGIGFNLALFGEPGTGKTFAVKDMILGNEGLGVPPHGLPSINRYCGGMTPAMFIAIGEAYAGRRFNFIVTEFNDWFKYKGMVEPLKLAMEKGVIRHETKSYTVGPYKFTSFFSVNYNTRVYERGYEVTVRDPNFNAIEERMLCRLHRLTKEKYRELSRSQRALMLGELQSRMRAAGKIRDHLTLVYAIQTKHPLVAGTFHDRKVLITGEVLRMLERARDLVLEHLGEVKVVPFSMRLERRALQLASAMSLMNYFNVESDVIPIDSTASKMAVQFFVEEAWVRSNEAFPIYEVLRKLALG